MGGIGLKVIYFCWGGAHSSVTAAAIHLGHLPSEGRATRQAILAAPRFDQSTTADCGRLILMGVDGDGNEVYTIGLGSQHRRFKYMLQSALHLVGASKSEYRLVNCLPCVNLATRIGGFFSRSLGVIWLGRPLVAWGVMRSYNNYTQLVHKIRHSRQQNLSYLDWKPPL